MRILFAGAQGTGKTTMMNCLPSSVHKIQGITRKVVSEGHFQFNDGGTDESQHAIFEANKQALKETPEFVSERSLFDVLAYTVYQFQHDKCSLKEITYENYELWNYVKAHPDDVYVYFPIEFAPVADGVRSVDEQYQKAIDNNIKMLLEGYNIKYITIHGSIEERTKILNKLLKVS